MWRLVFLLVLTLLPSVVAAQHLVQGQVVDQDSREPLFGAIIRDLGSKSGAKSNLDGRFEINLPSRGAHLAVELTGYERATVLLRDLPADSTIVVELHLKLVKGSEVLVTASQSDERLVRNEPRQTEAVPAEEIQEEMLMQPQGIGMMLREQNGVVQQTISAAAQSSSLRIAGLPGRYTQYLVDGMPAGGPVDLGHFTSLLPPLNLEQIEIVRGMDAARFGSGGVSGTVNLFTKSPPTEKTLDLLASVTHRGGIDGVIFGGAPTTKSTSSSLFASFGLQRLEDLNGDNYSDVPKLSSWKLAPSLEINASRTVSLRFNAEASRLRTLGGYSSTPESAIGSAFPYTEETISGRVGGSAQLQWRTSQSAQLAVSILRRGSERQSKYGAESFKTNEQIFWGKTEYKMFGEQYSASFGLEAELDSLIDKTERPQNARLLNPQFEPERINAGYEHNHYDAFALLNYDLSKLLSLEAGLRGIKQNVYGNFLAASAAAVVHAGSSVDVRAAASIGPRFPTVFLEEVEENSFRNFHNEITSAEKALSIGSGVNWHSRIDGAALNVTGSYYYSTISNPTIAVEHQHSADPAEREIHVRTSPEALLTHDAELSVLLAVDEIQFWGGFTYAVGTHYEEGLKVSETLLPKTKTNLAVSYEFEDIGLRVSAEHYILGPMVLDNFPRKESPVFMLSGLLVQKTFGTATLFVNAENIFNTQQPLPLILGDPSTGRVRTLPIYIPLEGRLISAGVLFKF